MSTTSKSPRKVAAVAYEVGRRSLPVYASRFSRKDFTQPQLFACLVLRRFHKTDYRGIVAILGDNSTLCADLELTKVPHFTTLQKAERKLLDDRNTHTMLTESIGLYFDLDAAADDAPAEAQPIEQVAADSTGFELDHASRYFTRRSKKPRKNKVETRHQPATYRAFAKLGLIACCATHLVLSMHRGAGPRPDVDELRPLIEHFVPNAVPEQLLADAGYDSEMNHELLRDKMKIDSLIPAKIGRPTDKLPTGGYRFQMQTNFDDETYGQRWQVETVMFMLKRHQGEALPARKPGTRHRELGLTVLTHNIMIC